MLYVWLGLLILLNTVWLALVVFGLPGNWLIVISTGLVAWCFWNEQVFGWPVLLVIVVLAGVGEILEFVAGLAGAKKAGGSRRGAVGALGGAVVGGIVGAMVLPIPIIAPLIGAAVGAGLGAWGLELQGGRDHRQSVKVGTAAGVGRLTGTLIKIVLGAIIWLLVVAAAIWP